jgi:hypothetical protein
MSISQRLISYRLYSVQPRQDGRHLALSQVWSWGTSSAFGGKNGVTPIGVTAAIVDPSNGDAETDGAERFEV